MNARNIAVFMLAAACALGSVRCGQESAAVDAALADLGRELSGTGLTYQYTGYDSAGYEIVRGRLVLVTGDSSEVAGTWTLDAVGDPGPMIGPQVGTGKLAGSIVQSAFGVNLNPDMIDNNVILIGTIHGGEIAGDWEFIGFPGVLNEGRFIAVRAQ